MMRLYFNLSLFNPLSLLSGGETDPEKIQLYQVIAILTTLLVLIVGWNIWKYFQKKENFRRFFRFIKRVKIDVLLEKDRLFRPQILTMTIENSGKYEADLNAPVIEFRKIWSKRRFKLNGIKGQQIYPIYLQPHTTHYLQIETATFHQYDQSIKKYYWARIYITDVDGRKWRSNKVKLRKSLFT